MLRENKSYTIRKSKKYRNLCGAILAGALFVVLGAGTASADEVVSPTSTAPETTLVANTALAVLISL